MDSSEHARLLRRVRIGTALFIAGLVLSGLTAVPLVTELGWLASFADPGSALPSRDAMTPFGQWVHSTYSALAELQARHPFVFYGTDWLAFGHIVIAIAFVGAWKDPVRNRWLFDFGLLACALVIPWARVFGALRGIPLWWRLVDCCFGVAGAVPLWLCRGWVNRLRAAAC